MDLTKQPIDKTEPWAKQAGEPPIAFKYFSAYRDMGLSRRLAALAKMFNKSIQTMQGFSTKYSWKERVHAWDAEMDRVKRFAELQGIEDMVKRHVKTAQMFERGLTLPAEALLRKIKKDPYCVDELEKMDVSELISKLVSVTSALDTVVDIERKSRGKPTEINATDLTSDGKRIHVVLPVIPPKID